MKTKTRSNDVQPGPNSPYRKLPVIGPILNKLLAWYRGRGYSESTIRNNLRSAGPLFRWLQERCGRALRDLTQCDVRAAYVHFRKGRVEVAAASHSIGKFLVEHHLIRVETPEPPSPAERQIRLFSAYLCEVRGLAPQTVLGHQRRLRAFFRFLRLDELPSAIRTLNLDQIEAFLRYSAKTNNCFSLQHVVASLRAFLRQQHVAGLLPEPLHQRIDMPRTYQFEQLPRALPWEQVAALLDSIDRSTPDGLRDFALLYLAARYGLRSGELVRLTLDDIDWRASTLKIAQTKTKQTLLLPLADESIDILARYLRDGRPRSSHRELFLRRRAPSGPLAPTAVHDILDRRRALSGLKLPPIGCHVLRHSLAVHLLRQGVRLHTIGGALGHRTPRSTAVYLRLAIEDLREVGLPVPTVGAATVLEPKRWRQRLVPARGTIKKRLSHTRFRSGLAESIRGYLATRRALGRAFKLEEAILRRWDDFLLRHYGKACKVRPRMFQRWTQTMLALTARVRRNQMRIVRNFLLFHARQHPDSYIPDLSIFPKPNPYRSPRLVSVAEMARVLATATLLRRSHQNPLRAQTIRMALVLLFCCGLRRGELLKLKNRDFDPHEKVLRIEATKFRKSRLVPLSDSVAEEVRSYLALPKRRQRLMLPDAPLLCGHNRLASMKACSPNALAANWQFLCLATGIVDERGRPPCLHDLRHSFAVAALGRWYQQGTDVQSKLPQLATYLGHVSPVSTHYYLHLSPDLGQAAAQRFHQYATQLFTPEGVQ